MQTLITKLQLMRSLIRHAGPYVLLELLLPGGTLLALVLLMFRSGAINRLQLTPGVRRQYSQLRVLVEQHAMHDPLTPFSDRASAAARARQSDANSITSRRGAIARVAVATARSRSVRRALSVHDPVVPARACDSCRSHRRDVVVELLARILARGERSEGAGLAR